MRDTLVSVLEVTSMGAIVAGTFGMAGVWAAVFVAGLLGLFAAWQVTR